jgi:predicted TIM-barrel fold metal-dependent hydrolase
MKVDTHFHIFLANAINQAQSRYVLEYDATIEKWEILANQAGLDGGVIVQPSFLGVDNTFLLAAIRLSPNKLKGVAVLAPDTPRSALLELKEQGVLGARLNLFGIENPNASIQANWKLIDLLNESEMHLELHHDDGLLNSLLLEIPKGTKIVVDHFGRPKTDKEFLAATPGIEQHAASLWVKLSAQYRTPHLDHSKVLDFWLHTIGSKKLLWGSDWPHTGFEVKQTYENQLSDLHKLVSDSSLVDQILISNPKHLYW